MVGDQACTGGHRHVKLAGDPGVHREGPPGAGGDGLVGCESARAGAPRLPGGTCSCWHRCSSGNPGARVPVPTATGGAGFLGGTNHCAFLPVKLLQHAHTGAFYTETEGLCHYMDLQRTLSTGCASTIMAPAYGVCGRKCLCAHPVSGSLWTGAHSRAPWVAQRCCASLQKPSCPQPWGREPCTGAGPEERGVPGAGDTPWGQ